MYVLLDVALSFGDIIYCFLSFDTNMVRFFYLKIY